MYRLLYNICYNWLTLVPYMVHSVLDGTVNGLFTIIVDDPLCHILYSECETGSYTVSWGIFCVIYSIDETSYVIYRIVVDLLDHLLCIVQ